MSVSSTHVKATRKNLKIKKGQKEETLERNLTQQPSQPQSSNAESFTDDKTKVETERTENALGEGDVPPNFTKEPPSTQNEEEKNIGNMLRNVGTCNSGQIRAKEEKLKSAFPYLSTEISNRRKAISLLCEAFSEFYRGLTLLRNFSVLNAEAVTHILRKYEKNIRTGYSEKYINQVLSNKTFYKQTSHYILMKETEHIFALAFTGGHHTAAMTKLRVPSNKKSERVVTFSFGVCLGISAILVAFIIYWLAALGERGSMLLPPLIAYRMLMLVVLLLWAWGLDIYIWNKFCINYGFIFEFNLRKHFSYTSMLHAAAFLSLLLSFSLFLMLISVIKPWGFEWLSMIHASLYPLSLFFVYFLIFLYFSVKSDWWLMRVLLNIIRAPFIPVTFKDFYIADQLVSLNIILYDGEYLLCYFFFDAWYPGQAQCKTSHPWIIPVLATLPALWRFLQCLRRYHDSRDYLQIFNAGKYSTSFLVILFSFLRKYHEGDSMGSVFTVWTGCWIGAVVVATIYGTVWDFKMDWSLTLTSSLREVKLYPTHFYHWAIVTNLIMRMTWGLVVLFLHLSHFHLHPLHLHPLHRHPLHLPPPSPPPPLPPYHLHPLLHLCFSFRHSLYFLIFN
eukprot:TRINITY_DN8298_c0_g1_i4.p1 TRINITY_DN8298_c0_g1~~TRINITY_DN8298_c0_g1_i4.p1  ORF type:complete len:618 (-),score=98.59 TRINITY_DN8298_c0_g1_i4:410-2263(-)